MIQKLSSVITVFVLAIHNTLHASLGAVIITLLCLCFGNKAIFMLIVL